MGTWLARRRAQIRRITAHSGLNRPGTALAFRAVHALASYPCPNAIEGEWSVDGRTFVLDGDVVAGTYSWNQYRAELSFAVEEGRLLTDALYPSGPTQGFIGTWSGTVRKVIGFTSGNTSDQTTTFTFEIGADGNAVYYKQLGSSTAQFRGRWVERSDGVDLVYRNMYGVETTRQFYLVGGALGLEHHQLQ